MERELSNVNITQVAEVAGVSKTTVSHVLSGKRPVAARTRERVERVMAELAYQPNFFAQALNSNRSNAVALIVQDITNPFYPALARGLQREAGAKDQVVMLFDAAGDARLTRAFVQDAISRRADGVVIAVSDVDDEVQRLQAAGIAVVAVGSAMSGLELDWVSADDERIGSDAVMRLHLGGRSSIAVVSGPTGSAPGAQRLAGYRRSMTDLDLPIDPDLAAVGDWTRDGGYRAMSRILDSATAPPDAVFCANDLMAIGALDAINARRLNVPGDIAVIGVDDIDAARLVRPALTSIRVPALEIGRAAGELLLRRIHDGPDAAHRHIRVQHQLISRETA
jgi:DNA-binding LacI/PurR family transcriptional regulator